MPAPGKVKLTVDVSPQAKRRLETLKTELRFDLPDVPRSLLTEAKIVEVLLEVADHDDVKHIIMAHLKAPPRGSARPTAGPKPKRS
jgi:hypothetical protein